MFSDVRPLRVPADWPAGASIACDSILLILIAPRRPQFLNRLILQMRSIIRIVKFRACAGEA